MSSAGPFSREFWIKDDVSYEHRPNVVTFPGAHARANAAYSARLLEEDRAGMRRELKSDLIRERREHMDRVAVIDSILMEIDGG